jgi:hypothetical protein
MKAQIFLFSIEGYGEFFSGITPLGVKPLIHQSELRTYIKVVPFKESSSFRFAVL